MIRESFARWQIPAEVEGIVLLGTSGGQHGRSGAAERHHHAELELHFVTHGRGVFLLGERRVEAEPGTLLWVAPYRDHTVLDPSADFRRWMLLARPRLVRRVLPPADARLLLAQRAAREDAPLWRTLPPHQARALAAKFAETRSGEREHFAVYNATIGYVLARAFKAFSATDMLPSWSVLHPAVAEAVRVLRDDAGNVGRAELARRCGASEWHLSKLFHAQVGVSLVEFRNRCRLDRFLELYGDGSRVKMTTAALDAGFGSYPQFHRVFRARMGYAPAEHARRLRAG
ncbi:MAG: helix-turn-helix transcriptional regulator [Thermodesulfobacteriota bacterium]